MQDINRLKLVLVELILPLFPNGALTLLSQTLKPLRE